jgi:membrane protein EpsK
MLIASVISFLGAILVWHHLTPMLHLRPSWFSLTSLRALAGMSGWIVVNTFGSLLYLSIDIVVVNILLGPEATGRYGAVLTWPVLLRSFAGVIAAVFGPTIFRLYSRGDLNELVIYSCRAVKCIGLVLAIPIGLICGMAKPLLYLWLGEEYVPLASLMSLMTFHLSVNLAVLPLFNIQVATNHVRLPCIVTCAMGLMNLVLAIALIRLVGWGMYSVAAAGAVMLTVKNIVFTPIYAARILGIYWTTYYINMLPVACITLFLIMLGWAVSYCLSIRSWLGLAAFAFPLSALTAVLIYAMALNRNERSLLMRLLVWRNTVAHK